MKLIVYFIASVVLSVASTQESHLIKAVLEDIEFKSKKVTGHIPNFHQYEYDDFISPPTTIVNGRFDMYSVGNEVAFWQGNSRPTVLIYGETYSSDDYTLASAAIYPFTVLTWINNLRRDNPYILQTRSFTGYNHEATDETFRGMLAVENYQLTYQVYQISGAIPNPSICEVFFLIENRKAWNSVSIDTFTLLPTGYPPFTITNTVKLESDQQNVMLGYTLYSKANGLGVTQSEVWAALNETLAIISLSDSPNRRPTPSPTPRYRPAKTLRVEEIMAQIDNVAKNIIAVIPFWYSYEYDTENSEIEDGGNDLYDFGNRVRFKKNQELYLRAVYNQVYYFPEFQFFTRTIYPFTALMWIENANGTQSSFTLQVDGNVGADQDGGITLYSATKYEIGKFVLSYKVFQIHSAEDPSVCELYFTVSSEQTWQSGGEYAFQVVSFSDETDEIVNSVKLSGRPQNILLGYMLLSKLEGAVITEKEIRQTLAAMVSGFDLRSNLSPTRNTVETTPITRIPDPSITGLLSMMHYYNSSGDSALEEIAFLYEFAAERIRKWVIRSWYQYQYDDLADPENSIVNGGHDLYNIGNQFIFFEDSMPPILAQYDYIYRFRNYDAIARTTYPFVGLIWIENPDGSNHSYTIQVNSIFAGSERSLAIINGSLTQDKFRMRFWSYQIYSTADDLKPSICEVYFTIHHRQIWNTKGRYRTDFKFSSSPLSASNVFMVTGNPQNVLMGYMLLSKLNGDKITFGTIRAALRRIPLTISEALTSTDTFGPPPSPPPAAPPQNPGGTQLSRVQSFF
ncbi:uncharacterized protein LOC143447335 [Clavelina lepadiformis]|uniref:uncharacterized protein LOC143447335 n=1 Tax=Clavelina lepadiformis TaxID=159417 RepID=UPI004042210F